MRPSVRNVFTAYQETFEGSTNWMYADVKNLVTTGIGNLVDPVAMALALPWKQSDLTTAATSDEVAAEWHLVKSRTELNQLGGGAYRQITKLRLAHDDVAALVLSRATRNENILVKRFPEYVDWPSDAQLGIHSLAWAEGPYFFTRYPHFSAAADRLDFGICADESDIAGPYTNRNKAQRALFNNAAAVIKNHYDVDVLYWPRELASELK